jgi:hypothetical protein
MRAAVLPGEATVLRLSVDGGEQVSQAAVSLRMTSTRLTFDFDMAFVEEATARALAVQLEEGQAGMRAHLAELGAVLPLVTIERKGKGVHLALQHDGNGLQQSAVLMGAISALAIHGVRQYLAASKAAEAKANVDGIARALARAVEDETRGGGPFVFPPSAPAVPPMPPPGRKYRSAPADWEHASWRAIHWQMSTPQYYSYGFETSKDGKTCRVTAKGDLDGDGVVATFVRELHIDEHGAVRIEPRFVIENELE